MSESRDVIYVSVRSRFVTRLVAYAASLALIAASQASPHAQTQDWPRNDATYTIDLLKTAGTEITDKNWLHLMAVGDTVGIGVRITTLADLERPLGQFTDIQVRYTVHGVPVSGWLSTPFAYTLSIDNPALDPVPDGVHDVSVEVSGATRLDYKPRPVYLHLARGRTVSPLVPIISRDLEYGDYGFDFGPGVVYVNYGNTTRHGHPVDPSVVAWHDAPYNEDLYQEEMAPHTNHFFGVQMWWEQAAPPNLGAKFVRALVPKWDEDHRGLRTIWHQDRFPFIDGQRGVAWTSPYITGQVDSTGGFAFVEAGGPLRYMRPDGEVITVAGWRVRPGMDPIWVGKPLDVVRHNEELRGQWLEGQYGGADAGFHTPLDVAIDPLNERIWYVAGYEDNCIWKVDATNFNAAVVSVFAGDLNHSAGFVDGTGHGARFHGPASLVFDPVADVIYVGDQDNDAIRRITRSGVVTTVVGLPGMGARLIARGVTTNDRYVIQQQNRDHSIYEVSAVQAALGTRPEIYMPQAIRVDSQGNLILLELGFGGIRRINPTTFETKALGNVWQRFDSNSNTGGDGRGWAWIDVDRWGNSGPLDSIYWTASQQSCVDGQSECHANEAYGWLPANGGLSRFVFGLDWDPPPDGWGPISATDPPHYGWLVAIDPRGAVYLAGIGEHGITRLRKRRATDPIPPDLVDYQHGKELWQWGGDAHAPATSFALKFGWEAHNYLGFSDAWDWRDATDAQLVSAFEIPSSIQADPPKLQTLLNFIRLNGGHQTAGSGGWMPPAPTTPTPAPTPPPTSTPTPPTSGSGGSSSSSSCTTPDPFVSLGGGTCVNGGWLPYAPTSSTPPPTTSVPTTSAPPPTTSSAGCTTPDPFVSLGGGTCFNGGWLPFRTTSSTTPPPPTNSSPPSSGGTTPSTGTGTPAPPTNTGASCTTPDPFVTLGGGTCYNGGWLPYGMPVPTSSPTPTPVTTPPASQPPASGTTGCSGPDPFASIPFLRGVCVNGGWVPVVR